LQQILEQATGLVSQGSRRSAINDCYHLVDFYPEKLATVSQQIKEQFLYQYGQDALAEAQFQEKLPHAPDDSTTKYYAGLARDQFLRYLDWYQSLTKNDILLLKKSGQARIRQVVAFLKGCYRLLGEPGAALEAFSKAASIGTEAIDPAGLDMWEQLLVTYPEGKEIKTQDELRTLVHTDETFRNHWMSFAKFLEIVKKQRGIKREFRQEIDRKVARTDTVLKSP